MPQLHKHLNVVRYIISTSIDAETMEKTCEELSNIVIERYQKLSKNINQEAPEKPDEKYLFWLNKAWENRVNRNELFGEIPIKTVPVIKGHLQNLERISRAISQNLRGFTGSKEQKKARKKILRTEAGYFDVEKQLKYYVTECPPIPFLGNHENEIIFISLEPLLQTDNNFEFFEAQIRRRELNNNFHNRADYFREYYKLCKEKLQGYWETIALLTLGYKYPETKATSPTELVELLATTVVEFPFIQYHAAKHPELKEVKNNTKLLEDFIARLCLFLKQEQNTLLFYGKDTWNILENYKSIFEIENILEDETIKVKKATEDWTKGGLNIKFYKMKLKHKNYYAVTIPQLSATSINVKQPEQKIQLGRMIQAVLKKR